MIIVRIIDTETTGLDPDAGVVEIGWTELSAPVPAGPWEIGPTESALVDPQKPIELEAMAVHHITPAMITAAGALPLSATIEKYAILSGADYYAAFKADFDGQFIPFNAPVICMWKAVLRMAPNARRHTNQFMRYLLRLDLDEARASPSHRAGPDTYVTAAVMQRALTKRSLADLIAISAEKAILPRLHFGEHAEKPCAEVPQSYWQWIMRTGFHDKPEVRDTAEHWLNFYREQAKRPLQIEEKPA